MLPSDVHSVYIIPLWCTKYVQHSLGMYKICTAFPSEVQCLQHSLVMYKECTVFPSYILCVHGTGAAAGESQVLWAGEGQRDDACWHGICSQVEKSGKQFGMFLPRTRPHFHPYPLILRWACVVDEMLESKNSLTPPPNLPFSNSSLVTHTSSELLMMWTSEAIM